MTDEEELQEILGNKQLLHESIYDELIVRDIPCGKWLEYKDFIVAKLTYTNFVDTVAIFNYYYDCKEQSLPFGNVCYKLDLLSPYVNETEYIEFPLDDIVVDEEVNKYDDMLYDKIINFIIKHQDDYIKINCISSETVLGSYDIFGKF